MRTPSPLRWSLPRASLLRSLWLTLGSASLLSFGALGCAGDLEDEAEYKALAPKLGLDLRPRRPNDPLANQGTAPPPVSTGEPTTAPPGTTAPPSTTAPPGTSAPPGTTSPGSTSDPPGTGTPPAAIPEACRDVPERLLAGALCGNTCHGSPGVAAVIGSDLASDPANAAAKLLNAPAPDGSLCAGHLIIDAANPEQSLLITKLDASPPCGLTMPYGGATPLSDADRQCIIDWTLAVAGGAQ